MRVHFKVTAWESVSLDDDYKEEVLEKLKSGEIKSANGLVEFLDSKGSDPTYEMIPESEQQLTIEENDGYSTIEAVDDDYSSVTLWENGLNPIKTD